MNDDRRALLNNIIANPGDDLPRLVFCDWLEEREESVDCTQCGGTGVGWYCDAAGDMDQRECPGCGGEGQVSNGYAKQATEIREQCANPKLWHPMWDGSVRLGFNRGFIAEVVCTMSQWEKYGPEICREHPVGWVGITDRHPEPPNGDARWVWWIGLADGVVDLPYMLPKRLNEGREAHLQFKTGGEARDWLSRRCIAWARSVNS